MRYIIIGYGNIGQKRKAVLGNKSVAIVDPIYPDADFENIKDVPVNTYDTAVVATHNSIKMQILEYLLINRKNVLVEKPLIFTDYVVAEKLDQISRKNKVIWYTSYNHRFEPLIEKLKENLDAGLIGEMHFANFTYGNGTVKNIAGTWRDEGLGVFEDLGCHLIDLAGYLFNKEINYKTISAHNYEAKNIDHCSFLSADGQITFTCSYIIWKNTFTIDVFGSKGSLHLNGLNKWGGASLIHRERIFPSGVPKEKMETTSGADETWEKDFEYFQKMIAQKKSSYKNDLNISMVLNSLITNKKRSL